MDYDFILKASQYGYPKYMEWYGAFGLMVTLIWLYTEILNLLAKFSDN
ncbi:Bax inhibitor-1/YccA family protein [Clostridium perfringens D]|nr:Bax inhibitor-1/YccA family protein [Clostridium perfringens D]